MKYLICAVSLLGVVSTSAGAQDDLLRFHPVEAFCIDYDMVRGGADGAVILIFRIHEAGQPERFEVED